MTLYLSLPYLCAEVNNLASFFCCMQKLIYLTLIRDYLKDSLILNPLKFMVFVGRGQIEM